MFSRRFILTGASVAFSLAIPHSLRAAEALKVGILIPGSKSDKGWMESGYDGLVASQKKYGDKIVVQMIENINYADMDQALTNLATKNDLVIGVGGQTQAAVYKIAKRFPNVHFSIVVGNEGESAPNVAGYDVKQAEIANVAGAAAAMLSKSGAVSYVGGMEIPSIVNAGKEFGNGAKSVNPNIPGVPAFVTGIAALKSIRCCWRTPRRARVFCNRRPEIRVATGNSARPERC